jgi:hypothetical protein
MIARIFLAATITMGPGRSHIQSSEAFSRWIRTGHLLVTLGDIRQAQKLGDASLTYYERALAQFIGTVGEGSVNTADVRCKIAVHFIKQEKFEESR